MYKKNFNCQQNQLFSITDFNIFATLWRGSSVGKSAGFITLRSKVQFLPALQKIAQFNFFISLLCK